jgi:hypothetical protein
MEMDRGNISGTGGGCLAFVEVCFVARVAHGEIIGELGLRYDIFEVFSLYPNTASDFGRTRTGNLGLAYSTS